MSEVPHDVAVIGAGVVGAAIARLLSHHELRCLVLEAADDVGTGTSKANTAIRHTGYDAPPGSLESALLARGYPLMTEFAEQAGVPIECTGGLLVAWDDAQLAALDGIVTKSHANGYHAIRPVAVSELYELEPHLGPGAQGGLLIPDEGIMCPFTTPLALATDAVVNGAELRLGSAVTAVSRRGAAYRLETTTGPVDARWVVNAAGLRSDEIDRMFGHERFTITPRRGQLIVFDKVARSLLSHVLLPVPSARTKGVLVAPTVFGNVLLGPTAEDLDDKTATETTAPGLASLLEKGKPILPELIDEEVTATYAGLRAATEHSDYQIDCSPDERYVCVGGIRSTGLSASLGIAAHVLDLLADGGLSLRERAFETPRMPMLGEAFSRPYRDEAAIAADAAYGEVVCFCERVTRGELVDTLGTPIPPGGLDGLRRRTRAMLGRCQGFYCAAHVSEIFDEARR